MRLETVLDQPVKLLTTAIDRCMAKITQFKWYWATRSAGLFVFLYEVFFDKGNPDRGTIIIAACGVMGFDKVARSESAK